MGNGSVAVYDIDTDVVVIGYGFAGGSAAIEAHDAGAEVLVLEKQPAGGGNSRFSYGGMFVADPARVKTAALVDWLDAMCMHTTPRDLLERFVQGTIELPAWITGLGGELTDQSSSPILHSFPRALPGPNFPKVAARSDMFTKPWLGDRPGVAPSQRLYDLVSDGVEARGIEVRFSSPVEDLLQDADGAVVGVRAQADGKTVLVRARRGVVMACGGFIANPELRRVYAPSHPMRFAGSPGNTGDGLLMAMRAGADLWHMTRTSTFIGHQTDEYEAAFCIFFHGPGFIWADKYGRRYIDETSVEVHDFDRVFAQLDPELVEFPRNPTWGILDEDTLRGGPMTWPVAGFNRDSYVWSKDNSAEVAKGWIRRAETIEELAAITGADVAVLAETLRGYNADCAAGADTGYGRPADTLRAIGAPYYAIKLEPVALNSQGGPRRTARAEVLGTGGRPITGLYAAGEFGSIWGYLYPGGGNITEALVYGRIAGQSASRVPEDD